MPNLRKEAQDIAVCVFLAASLSLAAPAVLAQSPGFGDAQYIANRVELVRSFFEDQVDTEYSLAAAQRLMVANGADLEVDGQWGPATAAQVAGSIQNMLAIGYAGFDSEDPRDIARLVMTWHTNILLAGMGLGDYPD